MGGGKKKERTARVFGDGSGSQIWVGWMGATTSSSPTQPKKMSEEEDIFGWRFLRASSKQRARRLALKGRGRTEGRREDQIGKRFFPDRGRILSFFSLPTS